jgi:hypothetical protein
MAEPVFVNMDAEAESLVPRTEFRHNRADKLTPEPRELDDESETNPLLGPPVLGRSTEKKWYNTASVNSLECLKRLTSKVFWLLPAFMLTALSFGATIAPKINLYQSLVCEDYYSERSGQGLSGPLPGGAYPVIEIGQQNPDCHIPQVF